MTRQIARASWILLAAFVIQNLEEILFLPGWARRHLPLTYSTPTQLQFALATAALTAMAGLIVAVSLHRARRGRSLLGFLAGALAANALTHVALSMATGSLMPGTTSSLVAQGPAAVWLMRCLGLARAQAAMWLAAGLVASPVLALTALAFAVRLVN